MSEPESGTVFYCDESGSAGLDSDDQPFYVTGGVLLGHTADDAVAQCVTEILAAKCWKELKGKELRKKPEIIVSVLGEARRLGGEFFFMVAERQYSIAQKIVDVLMDPAHNDRAEWLALGDDVTREAVAATLLGLPSRTLEGFASAYLIPTVASWRPIVETLELQCRLMNWRSLAQTFEGAIRAIETIVENENGGRLRLTGLERGRHFQFASLQLPYFCHVIRLVDDVLEQRQTVARVVHDNTEKFQHVFQWYFDTMKKVNSASFRWTSGTSRRNGITQLSQLEFADSTGSKGLQIADLLCAGVRLAFSAPDGSPVQRTTVPLIAPLFAPDARFARISASPQTKERLTRAFESASLSG